MAEINKQEKEGEKCLPIYPVLHKATPEIYYHTVRSQRSKPKILTYSPGSNEFRRRQALKGYGSAGTVAGIQYSWDEYPYASTLEGGFGAKVASVPWWENILVQGITLKAFYRINKMKSGDQFYVKTIR